MIQLKIYCNNTLGDNEEYLCNSLIFQNFYIGSRRDELNLLVVRRYSEGSILLQKNDFDNLKQYFFSEQSAQIKINDIWFWGIVKFFDINYLTKKVNVTFNFTDQYSLAFDGIENNGWNLSKYIPRSKEYIKLQEIIDYNVGYSIVSKYVDGSSYMYSSEHDMWGVEYLSAEGDKDYLTNDIVKFNSGGIDEEKILLYPDYYKSKKYKPQTVIYSNRGTGKFKHIKVTYIREFKYFSDNETHEGWDSTTTTKTINDILYRKYIRFYRGEHQTYFSSSYVYRIDDLLNLSSDTCTVTFEGIDTEKRDTSNFILLNAILRTLAKTVFKTNASFYSDLENNLYITSLIAYNDKSKFEDLEFSLNDFMVYLAFRHSIYLEKNNTISFKKLNFTTKLLDIDNFKGKNWYLNNTLLLNEINDIYEYNTGIKRLDFNDARVDFFGLKGSIKSMSSNITTYPDIETKEARRYIILKTELDVRNSINSEIYCTSDINNLLENGSVKYGVNGRWFKYVFQHADPLTDKTIFLTPYVYGNGNYHISLKIKITSGELTISMGSYSRMLTSGEYFISENVNGDTTKEQLKFTVTGNVCNAEIRYIYLESNVKVPTNSIGLISGLKKVNNDLSITKQIVDNKPLMAYKRGSMLDYGIIECEPEYKKEINFSIPLDENIFELDFNKYLALHNEKFIIFERKRQILTENKISKFDIIKAKSNEIY